MSQEPSPPRGQAASQFPEIDPRLVDELADRLGDIVVNRLLDAFRAEALAVEAGTPQAWLDAREVADRLHMSREWVYEHATELGVSRMGDGPRPRLRFPLHVVEARDAKPSTSPDPAARPTPKMAKPIGLIPIRGAYRG